MSETYDHLRERAASTRARAQQSERFKRIPVDPNVDPRSIALEDFNVANAELFRTDLVHGYFKRLREDAPIHYCQNSQYGPYWSLTKYQYIMEADKDNETFSSDHTFGGVTIMGTPSSSSEIPMFIQMDRPIHDGHRKAVAPRFTQRSLADLRAVIRQRAIDILEGLPKNETFNWVDHVSVELTGQMLATLFDVPQEDRHKLISWSNTVSNADNPEYLSSPADYYDSIADCGDYFQALWNRKVNSEPGADLISMLAHGSDTQNMTPKELLGNVILLLVGGNDTTRNSISGGLLALNDFPEQYQKLRNKPALIDTMVPEIVRWQTPLTHMRRTATKDVHFHGHEISEGDMVILWYLSGNRDSEVIDRADEFIIDRKTPREHLSFGFGIHRCLGNRLAEMQLTVLWEEIMQRYPNIEVVGEAQRSSSVLFRAITDLPVRISA